MQSHGDRLRVCFLQVADGDIVPWRERRVHADELVSRSKRFSSFQSRRSVPAEYRSRPDAEDTELTEDHPVTCRDENDITAVEAVACHHELAVDPLRWLDDFAVEKYWHSPDALCQQLQELAPRPTS